MINNKPLYKYKFRVRSSYRSNNNKLTLFHEGEFLTIKHNHDGLPELKKWIKCVGKCNNTGWVPREYIHSIQNKYYITRNFDANELNVNKGEFLFSNLTLHGYCFAVNNVNHIGWVPLNHLTLIKKQ